MITTHSFTLPEALTIQNIEAVAAGLKALKPAGETFTLDAGQTGIITTPGIQLILSLAATLKAAGGTMTIRQPKDSFRQAFAALGLAAQLAQWEKTT